MICFINTKTGSVATILMFALLGLPFSTLADQNSDSTTLETINVNASAETKADAGKDEVYSKSNVTEYKSKKEIETYENIHKIW